MAEQASYTRSVPGSSPGSPTIRNMNELQPVISDETSPDALNCIEVFQNSINDPIFSEFLKNTEEEKRENFFYLLCTNGLDGLRAINEGNLSKDEKRSVKLYEDSINEFTKRFKEVIHPGLKWDDENGWLNFYLNKPRIKDINYRVYLNTELEKTPEVFEQLIIKLRNSDLEYIAKIPSISEALDAAQTSRSDKITVYFDAFDKDSTEKLLSILEDINIKNRESFNPETPLFASRLSKMSGVSVAEDPGIKEESFNSIRAKILNDMYTEWEISGYVRRFNYEDSFQRCCKKYNVDPQEPWHNIERS